MIGRPKNFRLNRCHHLAQDLMLGYFGAWPGTLHAHDSSLFGNHGTMMNMAAPPTNWIFSTFLHRWCVAFDNTDDRLSAYENVDVPPVLFDNSPCTIASWGYLDAAGYEWEDTIFGHDDVGWGEKTTLSMRVSGAGAFMLRWVDSGGNDRSKTGSVYGLKTWRHAAITHDGATDVHGYLDGVLDWTETNYTGLNVVAGGAHYGSWGAHANGSNYSPFWLTDMCIWNRVLSVNELGVLANRSDPTLNGLIQPIARPLIYSSPAAPAFGGTSHVIGGGIVA